MTEDKLASALGVLRTARMSEAASARVREELDARWRERGTARRPFALPWFVPSIAAGVLFLALGVATLRSGADSALYGARVAIEDAIVAVHTDLDDRLDYIRELYDERTEEAARLEAVGNALAAGRARAAQDDALRMLNANAPKAEEPSPTPTPRPTPTTFLVTVRAYVVNPDGSPADGVCVSTAPMATAGGVTTLTTTPICVNDPGKVTGGTVTIRLSARKGQTITLYFSRPDLTTGARLHAQATFTVSGPTVPLGTLQLE